MIWKPSVLLLISFIAVAFIVRSPARGTSEQTVGLFVKEPAAFDGYTLFAPLDSPTAYLIDNEGRLVHSWDIDGRVGAYLLEDGSIIRGVTFRGAEWREWDGTLRWDFDGLAGSHHDIEVLPNGNVLMIVDDSKPSADAVAAGRDPDLLRDNFLHYDTIVEVEPTGLTTGNIVWEWSSWDHLIQDFDGAQGNHGVVADHPELRHQLF